MSNFEENPRKQTSRLLFVLAAGVFTALLLTFFMVKGFSPDGHYLASNMLISPETIEKLNDNTKGKSNLLSVDKVQYSYQDYESKQVKTIIVDSKKYTQFYNLIQQDKNITETASGIKADFNQLPLSSVAILTKEESQNEKFPIAQFLYKGDYYRIALKDSKAENEWIYFYHPNIYNETFNLFTK